MLLGPDHPADLTDDELLALNEFEVVIAREVLRPGDPVRTGEQFIAYERAERVDSYRRVWRDVEHGRVVGSAWLFWRIGDENRHLARMVVNVAPEHRREGRAKALLRAAAEVAQADSRPLIHTWTGDRQAAGESLCRAVGAQAGLVTHENRLVLAEVNRELLAAWVRAGESLPEYELVFVEIPTPTELLPAVAEIAHVINSAPRDDLQQEDERFTPEQIAAWDQAIISGGSRGWRLYVRERATGKLVGLTQIEWMPDQPGLLDQGDTGVLPEHRGRGLAKWLKAAMLERVFAELPAAVSVVTGNAYSNDAMLAINRELGFRPAGTWTVWQVETEQVLRYTSRQSARPLE